ncbi:DUF3311 domain-containing protein [Streptomyces sp. NPDC048479]|uniref:DUF3311 domain-containing protein n=1 Tax=Streptomyces sp. NPDC048479 TaxID=3154725 RepID=UPI0034376690
MLLLAPFVAMLWVSSYSKITPELGGVPFFYWYQLLWVPIPSAFTFIAYRLLRREEQQRRALKEGQRR